MTDNLPEVPNDFWGNIKSKLTEEEFGHISNIYNKNVVSLGTDQAFALRDEQGEIRAYKQNVRLSIKDKTLVNIAGNNTISAQGYEVLNEATGTCVILPESVLVNGTAQMNPFVERDSKNGRILAVYARAIAFRFSSKGIPQVSDWTTIFDTPAYRMIDLLAKAKKLPQAFKLLPNEMSPPESDKATWAKYPFDESTSLWINTSHDEALTWFSEIINREKKAMDFAQTFARRNASKHLHGLQAAPGAVWDIPVLCWRPTSGNIVKWDATQYVQLQKRVGGMIAAPSEEFSSPPQITQGAEKVSEEETTAEPEETEGEPIDITPTAKQPEKTAPVPDEEPPLPEPPPNIKTSEMEKKLDPETANLMNQYELAKANLWEEFAAACNALGTEPKSKHTPAQAKMIMAKMNEMMV